MLSSRLFECPSNLLTQAEQLTPLRTAIVNAETATVMKSAKLATEHNLIEPTLVTLIRLPTVIYVLKSRAVFLPQ